MCYCNASSGTDKLSAAKKRSFAGSSRHLMFICSKRSLSIRNHASAFCKWNNINDLVAQNVSTLPHVNFISIAVSKQVVEAICTLSSFKEQPSSGKLSTFVWHRMIYSWTQMTTVVVKGLSKMSEHLVACCCPLVMGNYWKHNWVLAVSIIFNG